MKEVWVKMAYSRLFYATIFALSLSHIGKCDYPGVELMTSQDFIGDKSQSGYTAAFGDVNSDKQTDVFVLSENGDKVHVFVGSQKSPALELYQTIPLAGFATSVVPADFDGDLVTDLLITFKLDDSSYSYSIYWGLDNQSFSLQNAFKSNETFVDEPLVLDVNADMIADLFAVYSNQTRVFLIGEGMRANWNFLAKPFATSKGEDLNPISFPQSHAFIDLTGEGSANLFVTSKKNDKLVYEVWKGSPEGLVLVKTINTADSEYFKDSNIVIGPAAFADFNGNARHDIVVTTCIPEGDRCKGGKILIYTDATDAWHVFYEVSDEWTFPKKLDHSESTIHICDFNLDSYPDLMMIMEDKKGIRKAVLLYNDLCTSEYCTVVGRQLEHALEMPRSADAAVSAFYDFNMDGTMDVIVTTKPKEDGKFTMKAYKNMIADDVTFLRVQVLSGLSDEAIFGVNVPGPQITYKTTNTSGGRQCGCLGQLSQSAHLSLQLPYVIFGLGRLANFVDSLTVSIPVPLIADPDAPIITNVEGKGESFRQTNNMTVSSDAFMPLNATWPMLIPNSQIYVIPYPKASPSSWKNKLLVTPSQNVIMTAIVLLGTCGLLGIVAMILHWLEKREDKQEKIQEAYGFHFDAM